MDKQLGFGRIDTVSKVINASAQTLYQAYMDPAKLVQWLPPQGMSGKISFFEPCEGGRYQLTLIYEAEHDKIGKTTANTDVMESTFKELIPDKKIMETGMFESDDSDFSGEITMTWYFEEVLEGTKVTIIAENVPEGIKKQDHIDGLMSTLDNLADFVEMR